MNLINCKELSQKLKVSESTIRKWAYKGYIKSINPPGKPLVFKLDQVENIIRFYQNSYSIPEYKEISGYSIHTVYKKVEYGHFKKLDPVAYGINFPVHTRIKK